MKACNKLKKIRIEKGMTQARLAKEVGTTQGVIASYELGKRKPKIETAHKLARALGVTVFDIVEGLKDETDINYEYYEVDTRSLFLHYLSNAKAAIFDESTLLLKELEQNNNINREETIHKLNALITLQGIYKDLEFQKTKDNSFNFGSCVDLLVKLYDSLNTSGKEQAICSIIDLTTRPDFRNTDAE